MCTERHIVCSKYNLDDSSKITWHGMLGKVWDNKFIGNRHVVVDHEIAVYAWNKPLEQQQGNRQSEIRHFV